MTADKIREVIGVYRQKFEKMAVSKADMPHSSYRPRKNEDVLAHCHGMLEKMEGFLDQNRIEKAFRWLGFIQGCLWSCGVYTLEELRNHSRPQ